MTQPGSLNQSTYNLTEYMAHGAVDRHLAEPRIFEHARKRGLPQV